MAKQLWLPSYVSVGMILQQQVSFSLHGRAGPSAEVRISLERAPFDGRSISPLDNKYGRLFDETVAADEHGSFQVFLPAFAASFDPFTLTVQSGTEKKTITDVLFGEVWVSGGQSNMQMPVRAVHGGDQVSSLANLFYIRILKQSVSGLGKTQKTYGYHPVEDISDASWVRGDQPEAVAETSAVGFSFVRELHLDLRIPVALIDTAVAATYIHSWISRSSIDRNDLLRQRIVDAGYYRDENDWKVTEGWDGAMHRPAALYNNKIAPLAGMGARGILWYQGESDQLYPDYYQAALKALVQDWRQVFSPVDKRGLGFLYVQLAPFFYGNQSSDQLAQFNEMLAAARPSLPGPAGLVPIYDLPLEYAGAPDDWRHPIHPSVKLPIGQRLKSIAMGLMYERNGPLSAPECADIEIIGNKMMLSFSNTGEGLRLTGEDTRLRGFSICGPDRIFVDAQARILYGVRVIVWHSQIREPQAVAYAHADMNQMANLISRDQLPVVPFRSDRAAARFCPPLEWTHCENMKIWCCPKLEQPFEAGWHPAWQIERGKGDLAVEKANKCEGDGSFVLHYSHLEHHEVSLEPLLHYDSLYPPLDLSAYDALSVQVFNTDQQSKVLRLAIAAGEPAADLVVFDQKQNILPVLRWQPVTFRLDLPVGQLNAVRRLVLILEDRKDKGTIYFDQISLVRPEQP